MRLISKQQPTASAYGPGARVITTKECPLGFFRKGKRGTVLRQDELCDSLRLVQFDNGPRRWVDCSEMDRIPASQPSIFQRLALAWLRVTRGARTGRA